jgi:hypothetical protein
VLKTTHFFKKGAAKKPLLMIVHNTLCLPQERPKNANNLHINGIKSRSILAEPTGLVADYLCLRVAPE